MPPYLPIRAIDRNRQLRIGGQLVRTNATSYIDLGQLPVPVGLRATETTTGGTGLASGGVYKYQVTAVDQYGGETPASAEVSITISADTTSYVTLRWLPIVDVNGNYTEPVGGYNVYRTANGGATGTEVFLANVSGNSIYNDGAAQTVAWGTTVTAVNPGVSALGVPNTTPPGSNNTYTAGQSNFSIRKELSQHSALGAYFTVGGLMNKGSDGAFSTLPTLGLAGLVITPAGGEVAQLSTGTFTPLLTTTTTLATAPGAGSERYDVVGVIPSTGQVVNITGPVTTQVGNAVLPGVDTRNTGQAAGVSVTTASGLNTLSVANTAGIQQGALVTGAGIPLTAGSYTYVQSVVPSASNVAGTVTLSANATASATVVAQFTNFVPLAVYLVNNAGASVFATPAQYAPRI